MSFVLIETDRKEIPEVTHKSCERLRHGLVVSAIERFIRSGFDCALVIDEKDFYANGNNMRRAFQSAIDRCGYDCEVIIRGNEVYLRRIYE